MQRILIVLLTLSTAVAAWFAVHYRQQVAERDARIAVLSAERDAAERAVAADTDPLRENIERLTRERDSLKAQARTTETPLQPVPALGAPAPGPNMNNPMAAMMKTEEGRKMLQSQATARVTRQYSVLAKNLKLSPQDSGVLLGLLADRQTAKANARIGSAGNSASLAAQTAAIDSEFDEKLRTTLGDQGYDEFSQYEQTVEERATVNQFDEQFAAAGTPLEPTQKESLIQLMSEERKKSGDNPFDRTKTDPATMLSRLRDETTFNGWVQQQEDFQNQVVQAASKTLTPDQVSTLKQSLQQKSEREKMGLQMFKTTGSPPPPPQRR